MPAGFSSKQVASVTGLALTTIDQLATTGVVPPSIAAGDGRGTSRQYSLGDVAGLELIARARRLFIRPSALRPIIERLQSDVIDANKFGPPRLVMSADGVVSGDVEHGRALQEGATSPSITITVDVRGLVERVTAYLLEDGMRSGMARGRGRPKNKAPSKPNVRRSAEAVEPKTVERITKRSR